ncbi:alpha/beta hydrolase [Chryseobacterium sp. T20]|uniref:alpha/beta hydrolase n=1 Tax=Chryseobacterium sp. T20 TaxID=3395375 RepID=UPI0039BC3AAA
MKKHYLIICLYIILCSCRTNNIPNSTNPNIQIPPNTTVAFVDLNGNFYTENWDTQIGPYKKTSSLYLTAQQNNTTHILTNFETKKLAEYHRDVSNKKRVFIFVHGYNNNEAKSKKNYDLLRTKINIDPTQDQIIEFYWDGLTSNNPFSSARIWFYATGYSQMAGEFGLRKILNEIHNKDIFIISHSRGASVVLSSLSNPPYNDKFRRDTESLGIAVDNNTPLSENANRIVCIMLAPAIGEIDFTKQSDNRAYRNFSPQLKNIHITTNKDDYVLKKFIGLQNELNPTTLGYNDRAYNNLKSTYSFFTVDNFDGQNSHSFDVYINNPKFQKMIDTYVKNK